MTVALTLTGPAIDARAMAADLLETLAGSAPEVETSGADAPTRDPATAVAVAALILSVPGAVLAGLELGDRLRKRRALAPKLEVLKTELERTGGEATLRIRQTTITLTDTPTDRILDTLSDELRR